MTRLVIDASVLVSAAVAHPDSRPTRLLEAVRAGQVEMLICDRLLGEVERALTGKYFTERVTTEERAAYLSLSGRSGSISRTRQILRSYCAILPTTTLLRWLSHRTLTRSSPATATFSNTWICSRPR